MTPDFEFPYEPYPLQLEFMRQLFQCIDQEKIGIFQSPTGTGKSLSLLCGSLSWLMSRDHLARMNENDNQNKDDSKMNEDDQTPKWVREWEARKKQAEAEEERLRLQIDLDEDFLAVKRRKVDVNNDEDEFVVSPYFEDSREQSTELDRVRQEYEQALVKSKSHASSSPEDRLKILFCSRTHSQLTQLIEELRKTTYSEKKEERAGCRVVPLGSRKQLCVNPAVLRLQSVERMNDECVDLQKKCGCPYLPKKNDEGSSSVDGDQRLQQFQRMILSEIHDIEDLVQKGKKMKTCPYYAVRDAIPPAQLVTMPYSMLLSPVTRRSLGISLKNNIVIIDEAHNLVDAINQLNSIQVSLRDFDETRQHLQTYLKKYQQRLLGMNVVYIKQLLLILSRICADFNFRFGANRQQDVKEGHSQSSMDCVLSIADYVHSLKIDHINLFKIQKYLEDSQLAKKLNGFVEKHVRAVGSGSTADADVADEYSPRHTSPLYQIEAFLMLLNNPEVDGKILIHAELETHLENNVPGNVQKKSTPTEKKCLSREKTNIQFLLLNPANYFQDVVDEARSIILAGGTMDPLDDLIQQLFPKTPSEKIHTFSSDHIIEPSNLQTLIISQGPTAIPFEFSFEKRKNADMIREAGETVLNLSRVVPGGVVVFFASFQYLEFVLSEWKRIGSNALSNRASSAGNSKGTAPSLSIWDRLSRVKRLFVEPRNSAELDKCLKDYSDAILSRNESNEHSIMDQSSSKLTGAILFSVVGGKMSEGINFANDLGRAVIMIGVPFPNLYSPELREKMRYMDITAASSDNKEGVVNGKEYYENVCMRAVNQSIGRAIRHRNDYACVILLDKRYAQPRIKQKLPAWMKQSIYDLTGSQGQFGELMRRISSFFKFHKSKNI